MTTTVKAKCGSVTLRLRLNDNHLRMSLRDAVVSPFLKAHAKKTGTSLQLADVSVQVNGERVDVDSSSSSLLSGSPDDLDGEATVELVPNPMGQSLARGGGRGNGAHQKASHGVDNPMASLLGGMDPSSLLGQAPANGDNPMASMLGGMDPTALLGGMDPKQLSEMMKSMQHLLPPELKAKAEKINTEELVRNIKTQRPPSADEVAFAGVNAVNGLNSHTRTGPIFQAPAEARGIQATLRKTVARAQALEREEEEAMAQATAAVSAVAPGARVRKLATIDGRLLVVLDGALDSADVEAAELALDERAAFRKKETSDQDRPDQRHLVTEHDATAFCATALYKRIATLAHVLFDDDVDDAPLIPARVYTNAMSFGDVAHVHRDDSGPHRDQHVTALLYPNATWDASLAGETLFFSEDGDAREAVLPQPGRLLLFTASIRHVGRPPSRLFWGHRYTMAIKFNRQYSR